MNGVLYFHRISDVRMGGAARRNLTMFQKLCGPDAFKNVAIVTTRWDEEEKEIAESRLVELKKKPFKEVLDGGGEIFRHDRSSQSAKKIITHLASKDAISLLIQREIVEDRKELAETAAGEELHREIMQQVEKHKKEMSELIEEMEQAHKDSSMLQDLENECLELRERMAHWQAESEKLANPDMQKLPKTGLQLESSLPQEPQVIQGAETSRAGNGKDVDQPTSSDVPLIAPSTSPQASTSRPWSSLQTLKEYINMFVGSPSQWFTLMRSACNYLLSFCATNPTVTQEAQETSQRMAEEGESDGGKSGRATV